MTVKIDEAMNQYKEKFEKLSGRPPNEKELAWAEKSFNKLANKAVQK